MSLKTKRITVTIPGEFVPLLKARMKEEHIKSESRFFVSLLLFDLMKRHSHKITASVVNDPDDLFYKVVDEIVRDFPNAKDQSPGWLNHRIEDMVEASTGQKKLEL